MDEEDKEICYWKELKEESDSSEETFRWKHPEESSGEDEEDEKPEERMTLEKQDSEIHEGILPTRHVAGRSRRRVLGKKRRPREDRGSRAAQECPEATHASPTEKAFWDRDNQDSEGVNDLDAKETFFMTNTIVRLNVGGIPYWTLPDTLIAASFFDRLLKDDRKTYDAIVSNQDVFINRNGRPFEYIHQHLITSQTDFLPSDPHALLCLRDEIWFYGLDTLAKAVDKRILNACGTRDRPRTWYVLPMTEFEASCRVKGRLLEEYELIGTFETQDAYWVCPRDIHIHSSPSECGKACKRSFDPDFHGWHFMHKTKAILASKEGQLSGQ